MSPPPVSLDELRRLGLDRGWALLANCPLCGCAQVSPLGISRGAFGICVCDDCKIVFLNPRRRHRWRRYREATMPHGYLARLIELGLLTSELEPNLARISGRMQRVVRMVKSAPAGPVLELGCGIGLTVLALRAAGLRAWGIESAADFAEFANRVLDVDVTMWDLHSDPPLDRRAAAIVLNNVLEYQESPVEFLRLVREKALLPGGEVVLMAPNLRSAEFVERGLDWPLFSHNRLWYFTDDTLARVARRAGYSIAGSHWAATPDGDGVLGRTAMYVHNVLGLNVNVTGGIGMRLTPTG